MQEPPSQPDQSQPDPNQPVPAPESTTPAVEENPIVGTPPGMRPHRGVLVLVLGLTSPLFCLVNVCVPCGIPITGIIAGILGIVDLKAMNAGQMDPSGKTQTMVGAISGGLFTLGYVLYFIVAMIFTVLSVIGGAASGY